MGFLFEVLDLIALKLTKLYSSNAFMLPRTHLDFFKNGALPLMLKLYLILRGKGKDGGNGEWVETLKPSEFETVSDSEFKD